MLPPTAPAGEVLDAAADYIERHGLCKGSLFPYAAGPRMIEGVPVCAYGAIIAAYRGRGWTNACTGPWLLSSPAVVALTAWIGTDVSVWAWSDNPLRTKGEVAAGLRAAARARGTAVLDVIPDRELVPV